MLNKDKFFEQFSGFPERNDVPTFDGFDIYFEKLSMDGLDEMHKYSLDDRLYEFFEFDAFKDISETESYINKLLLRMANKGSNQIASYWFVRRKKDNKLLGSAGLVNLNYDRQSIELGFGVNPHYWGRGYILQIQEILKIITFDILSLNRLGGITSIRNHSTINSVLAAGMLKEGVIRDYMIIDGEFHDALQYGMTKSDYLSQLERLKRNKSIITLEQILTVVSSVLEYEIITNESSMENTSSWDSMSHMEIILALKGELSINLLPSEVASATSIENIFEIVLAQA